MLYILLIIWNNIIWSNNDTLLYKIKWFIDFSATNKIANLTCVDYHETHESLLLYFCGAIGLVFSIFSLNCTARSQSELRNFFMYIIILSGISKSQN